MKLHEHPNQHKTTTTLASLCIEAWAARARGTGATKGAFVLDGAKVTDKEMASATGLLPVLAWHAENLYRYAVRPSGFGFRFTQDEESLLQRSINLDRTDRCVSEVLCFMIEAAEDAHKHLPKSAAVPGATELRSLVNQFSAAMGLGAVPGIDAPLIVRPQA